MVLSGWAAAKQMLSDVSLLRALQVYKKDDMKDRQVGWDGHVK